MTSSMLTRTFACEALALLRELHELKTTGAVTGQSLGLIASEIKQALPPPMRTVSYPETRRVLEEYLDTLIPTKQQEPVVVHAEKTDTDTGVGAQEDPVCRLEEAQGKPLHSASNVVGSGPSRSPSEDRRDKKEGDRGKARKAARTPVRL